MADSSHGRTKSKDMYWFAHGGEPSPEKNNHRSDGDEEIGSPDQHNSPSWKPLQERKALPEEARSVLTGKECAAAVLDGPGNSTLLSRVERDDRVAVAPDSYGSSGRVSGSNTRPIKNAEDEKLRKITEAEQDPDSKARKKVDREAALEAKRNAHRSNVSFAFGSSLPRNLDLDVTTVYQGSDLDKNKRRSTQVPVSSSKTGPVASVVSKTREEGLAYAHKAPFATFENTETDRIHSWTSVRQPANCLVGSGAFVADDKMSESMISPMSACRGRRKTDLTPTIPYERTAPPRTLAPPASSGKRSVSMTRLDQLARPRRSYVEAQRDHAKASSTSSTSSVQKDIQNSPSRPRSSASEHSAGSNRPSTTPPVNMRARTAARKPRPVSIAGTVPDRKPTGEFKKDSSVSRVTEKKSELSSTKKAPTTVNKAKSPAPKNSYLDKPGQKTPIKNLTPKSSPVRKLPTKTKKQAAAASVQSSSVEPANVPVEETLKIAGSPTESPVADEENGSVPESGGKRIISEEEAKAALAEKRRLAREQAEKEAELERQRQEELRRQEEERIREEEEEQRKMEEEQLRLLDEHRKHEEEKLRKAIEEQERKEQEEKLRREEEARLKAEQERKAKEEAERQRIELEEKLRKEEEERAERKKRLEKIMSRTRGKGTSSASSHGDQSDSADSQAGESAEALSGNSSLNSVQSTDPSSGSASLEIPPESIQGSENESLNSMEMMALSENSSLDSNLLMLPSDGAVSLDSDQASTVSNQNISDEKATSEVKNLSYENSASHDTVESSMLLSASSDNPSSYSSETETVVTDSTSVLTKERTTDQASVPLVNEDLDSASVRLVNEDLDSASDKLLHFGIDSVQTLVSQPENGISADGGDFSVTDKSIVGSIDDNSKKPFPTELGFVSGESQVCDSKSEFDTFSNYHLDMQISECQEFATNPFTASSEILVTAAAAKNGKIGKAHSDEDENIMGSDCKSSSPLQKEVDVNAGEDGFHIQEKKLFLETSQAFKESSLQCHEPPQENLISVDDSINFTTKITGQSDDEAVDQGEVRPSGLPSQIFDSNSEQFVENVEVSQSFDFRDTRDGNSDQYSKISMPESSDLVINPFAERESVSADNSNVFPKENSSLLVKMEDSVVAVTSLEDLEPSAIETSVNLPDEYSVNAAAITDSEDSSLDSNLSQVMTVNIINSSASQESGVLISSPLDIVSELSAKTAVHHHDASSMPFQKMSQYISNDYAPTTNGYQSHGRESFSYGNGIDGNCKTSSLQADHAPMSSLMDNEINSNVISPVNNHHIEDIFNTGDINFNKVPSNPFLATGDSSEVSENQFLNQEEIMRSPVQTEFHA